MEFISKSQQGFWAWLIAGFIICIHVGLGFTSALQKTATFDEPLYIAGGYISLKYNDYRTNSESGQLGQRWAALPFLALNIENSIEDPVEAAGSKKYTLKSYAEGKNILYKNKVPRPYVLTLSRLMILIASGGLGIVLFLWSRAIWGQMGALVTVAVYSLSPTTLAHARLVTADLVSALFFVLAVMLLWRILHRLSLSGVIFSGLTVGGVLLAKFSGLMIGPMALGMATIRIVAGRPLIAIFGGKRFIVHSRWKQLILFFSSALIVLFVAWIVIWLLYGFRFSAAAPDLAINTMPMRFKAAPPLIEILYAWQFLPESFLYGLSYTLYFMKRAAFMNGNYSITGWPSFFPYAILIKTALPILFFTALFPFLLFVTKKRGRTIYALIPLVVLVGVVLTFAINSNLNIGHRHILPIYPVLAIFAGAASRLFDITIPMARRFGIAIIVGLILWLAAISLWIWPHYLAYFNPLIGGPSKGYQHLVDSSLDWGQDLRGLARWLKENPQTEPNKPLYLLYFGSILPQNERIFSVYEGIPTMVNLRHLPSLNLIKKDDYRPGRYCISATDLQRVYNPMRGPWTPERENAYQNVMPIAQTYFNRKASPQRYKKMVNDLGMKKIEEILTDFAKLRFARLLAYLRYKDSDAMIGYTILVYDLAQDEISAALYGPVKSLIPSSP